MLSYPKMAQTKINKLVSQIAQAKLAYYNTDEPIMTDEEYDYLIDDLKRLDPTNAILTQVGAPVESRDAVELPIAMSSLDKIDNSASLTRWVRNNSADKYHISDKLDGVSALWFPVGGKLYTRGDGIKGRDISVFAPFITGLARPKDAGKTLAIRGELIMKKSSKFISEDKAARSVVVGLLARKSEALDKAMLAEVEFIAYELLTNDLMTPSESYEHMEYLGYKVSFDSIVPQEHIKEEYLKQYYEARRFESEYELDGIVVIPDIPRDNLEAVKIDPRNGKVLLPKDRIAWKLKTVSDAERTTVTYVEWNESAHKSFKPVVHFTPIKTSRSTLTAATGLHAKWIIDNQIGPGAVIIAGLANETIPRIFEVVSPSPTGSQMPEQEYEMVGVEAKAVGESEAFKVAELVKALKELNAKNVGEGTVTNLYKAGFKTIRDIYRATTGDFASRVARTGAAMAERIYEGLRFGQETWDELTFMVASNKFPLGIGSTKLRSILVIFPDPKKWSLELIATNKPRGISLEAIGTVVESLPAYFKWYQDNIAGLLDTNVAPPVVKQEVQTGGAQAAVSVAQVAQPGKQPTIVLTGFRDPKLSLKYNVLDNVTKSGGIDYVVYRGSFKESGSTKKAEQYGIKVIELNELLALG
jgi:DNA ligase (NAD+)